MPVNTLLTALFILLAGALVAGGFAIFRMSRIFRLSLDHEKLRKISTFIAEGAMAFLTKEYQLLLPVLLVGAAFIWIANRGDLQYMALTFLAGAIFSASAGFLGMKTATTANSRTTNAAQKGLNAALKIAYGGGSVTGMAVLALALAGVFGVCILGTQIWGGASDSFQTKILPLLIGFSLGASAFALFARVGGGIFTKAADVGADLVGKLEAGIPEDDHRNPAVIADNVGDNVGDLAGMAADLFSSFVGALTGAVVLAFSATQNPALLEQITSLPFALAGFGVLASLAGILLVRVKGTTSVQKAINRGNFAATGFAIVGVFALCRFWVTDSAPGFDWLRIAISCSIGLVAGSIIGGFIEYFTAQGRGPVQAIVKSSDTGPATNIITGIGMGMMSNLPVIATIFAAVLGSFALAGIYGVAIGVLGMLIPLGIQMTVSAYGPIADNAGGLAEMAEFPAEVREVTDRLDSVGNTTSAVGKGYAISSTAMTAVILCVAFKQSVGIQGSVELLNIAVLSGLFLGAMIPFVFASLNMNAIGKAAFAMIEEVRRQFREKPGILAETEEPDYRACVNIATSAALQEMVLPGLIAVLAPLIVGYLAGVPMLLGMLCGTTVSGIVLGLFMTNSGGAWDNAKKTLEGRGAKGTDAHKAAIVGDTVGDPFKDTAGPSLNILIKLMTMVALLMAPALKSYWGY